MNLFFFFSSWGKLKWFLCAMSFLQWPGWGSDGCTRAAEGKKWRRGYVHESNKKKKRGKSTQQHQTQTEQSSNRMGVHSVQGLCWAWYLQMQKKEKENINKHRNRLRGVFSLEGAGEAYSGYNGGPDSDREPKTKAAAGNTRSWPSYVLGAGASFKSWVWVLLSLPTEFMVHIN